MTPREFRQEKELEFDHFQELTSTGIKPNYVNIELFAHEYHQAKLKLLGIADVVGRSEQLACDCDRQPLRYNELGTCKYCGKQKPSEG